MDVCKMVEEILLKACDNVYHNKAQQEPDEYIVWRLYSTKGLRADGTHDELSSRYEIEIHTKIEFSKVPERLRCLCDIYNDAALDDPAISYDEKTGYTHYVYMLEVV